MIQSMWPRLAIVFGAALLACLYCSSVRAAAPRAIGWHAVLVAGDDAQPVFDNAVAAFDHWLTALGVPQDHIHRLSARPADRETEPASVRRIVDRIAGLQPQPGEGCLVFITSHGKEDEGVWLAHDREFLWPVTLAQALSIGCGEAPTVAIVSSCYSGSFARGSMRAPNRVILTAARADLPSFGCQADRTYTVFDECLLATLQRASNWQIAYRDQLACVGDHERQLHVLASHPQAFFGAAERGLPVR